MTRGEFRISGNHAEFFLPRKSFFADLIPSFLKPAFVFIGPLFRYVMRRMCCPGREVDEKWFIGYQCFLLADPEDGFVGHVFHKMIPFFRCPLRFYRCRALVDGRVPLVCFTTNKTIEIFK